MAGVRRRVRVGSISYVDPQGRTRRADAAAVVDVDAGDVERFDIFNRLIGESPEEGLARSTEGLGAAAETPPPGPFEQSGVGGQPDELAARAADLDARAAALDSREVAVAELEQRQSSWAQDLDARETALDARAAEVDELKAALEESAAEPKKAPARPAAKAKASPAGQE